MPPDSHSVTRWIERLQSEDPQAAAALWERFLDRMVVVARQRLGSASRRVADEEDVVVVAFERFLSGVRQGRFPRLNNRDDLWAVLFTLTTRLAARQVRDLERDKRGGAILGESEQGEEPAEDAPTPLEALLLQENMGRLLALLPDPQLRQIALARLEGCTNAEIAGLIGRSVVTVERRLRRIREMWELKIEDDLAAAEG